MSSKYIIRLDDACPTMDREKWLKVEEILSKYNVKPIVAVIPNNKDQSLLLNSIDDNFWSETILRWKNRKWDIALHGFDHLYITNNGGLVPKNKDSEFAGVSLELQENKIKEGVEIFKKHNIEPKIWVAPSHSFDENTLLALKKHSKIDIVSDGISIYPYKYLGFKWIPQQLSNFQKKKQGVWTICLHPNTMPNNLYLKLEAFLKANNKQFVKASEIEIFKNKKGIQDNFYAFLYWKKNKVIKFLYKYYLILKNKLA